MIPLSSPSLSSQVCGLKVLDLFSAAAGGWSLGMHRAGFRTVAACEVVPWRRALYAQNFPDVRLYDDVRTLTADRLLFDLGDVPDVVVGSPPCQDVSSANTKGKGVDGARSRLVFEAIRVIGEVRPRWFALENSPEWRTRGYDRIAQRLEGLGLACWPVVVGASDLRANHLRRRTWLLGCDPEQVTDAASFGSSRIAWTDAQHRQAEVVSAPGPGRCDDEYASSLRHESGRPRGCGSEGNGATPAAGRNAADADCQGQPDSTGDGQVGRCSSTGGDAQQPWSQWNGGLAHHLRVDDGLSAWVAQSRIAVGGPRGTAAANLLVEAFGDAVLPQIPEAIGRAILRTEAALAALYAPTIPPRAA